MRIAYVGGVERSEKDLVQLAALAGHDLTFHSGHVGGRGAQDLKSTIDRCDLIVILTDVNSHGGVQLARKLANKMGKGTLLVRRMGVARFQALLDAISTAEPLLKTGS